MTKTWTRLAATAAASSVITVGLMASAGAASAATVPGHAKAKPTKVTRSVRIGVANGHRYQIKLVVPKSKKHGKATVKANKNHRTGSVTTKGATVTTTTITSAPQLTISATVPTDLGRNVTVIATPLPAPTAQFPVVTTVIPSSLISSSSAASNPGAVIVGSGGTSTGTGSTAPAAPAPAAAGTSPTAIALAGYASAKVTWSSGVAPAAISNAAADQFATFRGHSNTVISAFPERSTWKDIRTGTWVVDQYKNNPATLALGIPLLPDNEAGTLADVANGLHDADFQGMAANLVSHGRGDSKLRIGWEFNGDWMKWSATDPATFIAAYRHVAAIFRAASPKFELIWNGTMGENACGHDSFTELYPGDDVVDGIGVDAYDMKWWAVTDADSFATMVDMPNGLNAWAAFASSHHKPISVPEWGLDGATGQDMPGDQPAFITGMHEWFAQQGSNLDYEAYFDDPADYQRSSLVTSGQNASSSATYAQLWSA